MLGGGFLSGDSVLVAGGTGTGKTTLGLQYVVNGATQFGENGIFVTFEQMPDQLYRDAKNFGWDLKRLEQENKLKIFCTSSELLLESHGTKHFLDEPIRQVKPRRIVIDSLSNLAMYIGEKEVRKEAYRLLHYFKTKQMNSLCTWEAPGIIGQGVSLTDVGISRVADCVILLRLVEIESQMHKALVVLKLRGSDHDKALREFEITSQGITVAQPFTGFESIITGVPRRVLPMQKTIDEAEAEKIALEYVKKQESGAQAEIKSVERQDIWALEVSWAIQTEKTKGTQYANVTVSGTGKVKDYEKTRFQSGSVSQRIKSKLRSIFSRSKP
jgi:circadian clock protein KaiC